MTIRRLACALLVHCLWANPVSAQLRGTGLEIDNYKSIEYLIEALSEGAKKVGLNESRIVNKVELRLRQAGLKPSEMSAADRPYLYVQMNVVGRGFSIKLAYKRRIIYNVGSRSFELYGGSTWDTGLTGNAGDADYIMGGLDDAMDVSLTPI